MDDDATSQASTVEYDSWDQDFQDQIDEINERLRALERFYFPTNTWQPTPT